MRMHRLGRFCSILAFGGIVAIAAPTWGQGLRRVFSAIDVSPPATAPVDHVVDIAGYTNAGSFAGTHLVNGQRRAFACIDGAWYDLGLEEARAVSINDANTVLVHGFGVRESVGYLWNRENGLVRLGSSQPEDLSSSALVANRAGSSFILDRDDPVVFLPPLQGGTVSIGRALVQDVNGVVAAGSANTGSDATLHGVAWIDGEPVDLTPETDFNVHVTHINQDHLIVGWRETHGHPQPMAWIPRDDGPGWMSMAFLEHPDVPRDLSHEHDVVLSDGLWTFDPRNRTQRFVPVVDRMNIPVTVDMGQPIELQAINDAGVMLALAQQADGGRPAILEIQPFDFNNNGVPDYRDIARGTMPDADDDGIIDIAQRMRCGFYNISVPWRVIDQVKPIQVVRIILDQNNIARIINEPDSQLAIDFNERVNGWGYERQAELVLSIRTPAAFNPDLDYIPTGAERAEILETMSRFAERYARAIDYVQIGNESLGGIGGFYFSPEQVPCHGGKGGTIKEVGGECLVEVVAETNGWLTDQAVAIRRGSHRAGRPLQILSPAVNEGHLALGAKGDPTDMTNMRADGDPEQTEIDRRNRAALVVVTVFELEPRVFDLIDLHGRYHHETNQLLNAPRLVYSAETPWGERGLVPAGLSVTEWAPMPLPDPLNPGDPGTWFQAHMATPRNGGYLPNIKTYFRNYDGNLPPPEWSWSELLHDWRLTETSLSETFGIPQALRGLDRADVVFACYAPFNQYDNIEVDSLKPYNISAIFARDVKMEYLGHSRFTVLRGIYEFAARPFIIEDFKPHPHRFE